MKNKTIIRSMDILQLFIEHSELTFQEIIDLSGIPKSSVYRMLKSLEEMEFLEKGADAKYRLGLLFLTYGSLVANRIDLRKVAYPIMEALHEDVEQAVNLIIRQEDEAMYIEKIDTKQKVRLYTAVGRKSPLYAGACSRVIFSFLSKHEREEYLDNTVLHQFASGTITDKNQLLASVKKAHEDGYTISYSELEDHTTAIAAPIFNHKGNVIGGLSIAGIEANYTEDNITTYAQKVIKAANNISTNLGNIQ